MCKTGVDYLVPMLVMAVVGMIATWAILWYTWIRKAVHLQITVWHIRSVVS